MAFPDPSGQKRNTRPKREKSSRKEQLAQAQKRRRDKLKAAEYVRFNFSVRPEIGKQYEKVKRLSQLETHEEILELLVCAWLEKCGNLD